MINIAGAGLAGLLAANMLRHRNPVVYEKQPSLPNNHSAVLRFRTPAMGDVLNIPFKRVTMIKTYLPWKNPVADAMAYSFKNTGAYRSDRSIIDGTVTADRYIAPPDLIEQMAARVEGLILDCGVYPEKLVNAATKHPVISTIPMPSLMEMLGYPDRSKVDFNYRSGVNIRAVIDDCDAYVSIIVPDPALKFSRISITGNELIVECTGNAAIKDTSRMKADLIISAVVAMLGIDHRQVRDVSVHEQRYAKINPIDDGIRKEFMFWATDKFNIFSLGRFATWRPGLLLDDIVKDVRLIDGWINNKYAIARHR